MNTNLSPGAQSYFGLWTQHIAEGLARIMGAEVGVEASPIEAQPGAAPPEGVWVRLFAGKAGEQGFFLPNAAALHLAKMLMGGAPEEAGSLTKDDREAVVQFFEQITTMIPVAGLLGFEAELATAEGDRPAWESAAGAAYRFFTPQETVLSLDAVLSADFLAALDAARGARSEAQADASPSASAPPPQAGPRAPKKLPAGTGDVNLDLLMDVDLEVTLRFGQRQMLLGDVLKLTAGSVVELDQEVKDPVELLVGSKVIAWGEVVTVDGSYGLRITGLASREERLESLRK